MKVIKTLSMVLVVMMVFTGAAMAGPWGGHHKGTHGGGHYMGHHGGMDMGLGPLMHLDLTEAQKTEIAKVLLKYRDEMRTNMDNFITAKEAVADAILAEEFNEASVREAFQQASAVKEESVVTRAKMMFEIRSLLTDEQITELNEHRAHRKEMMQKMMEKKRERFDAWLESYTNSEQE